MYYLLKKKKKRRHRRPLSILLFEKRNEKQDMLGNGLSFGQYC
jgi:hypothetical protein